jgi:hypothetical protein
MAAEKDDSIRINVNLQIRPSTLQTIVANAKKKAGCDAEGRYHIDTAEKVESIISQFLLENNFHEYVQDLKKYE